MAVKSKSFDPATKPLFRSTTFTNSDFVQDDILDIEASLGRPAKTIVVDAGSTASVTFRLNAYQVIYPLEPISKADGIGNRDWSQPGEIIDTNLNTVCVENGDSLTITDVIKNIQITALTAGNGISIKVS